MTNNLPGDENFHQQKEYVYKKVLVKCGEVMKFFFDKVSLLYEQWVARLKLTWKLTRAINEKLLSKNFCTAHIYNSRL